jgi:uncharacterized delta-60 repeat protein
MKTLLLTAFLFAGLQTMAQNDADRDASFNISGVDGYNPGPSSGAGYSKVTALPGGKVLATGAFYGASSPTYNRLFRLNADGSFDGTFNSGSGASGSIAAVRLLSDGKILLGGGFPDYDGTSVNGIVRIHPDGTRDNSFNTGTGFSSILPPPWVFDFAEQADGKIIVVGAFTSFNGTSIAGVLRLNTDGSLDTGFDPGSGPSNIVQTVALQSDGKILVGGTFGSFNGNSTGRIARLLTDGTVDTTFNTATSGDILRLVVQADGKILAGGNSFYRLMPDGSIDAGFNRDVSADYIKGIALQADGKAVVSGFFETYNGINREHIVRLNTDGSVDLNFDSELGFDTNPTHLDIQADGKIIVFGGYKYKGTEAMITRIMGSAVTSLSSDAIQEIETQVYPNPTSEGFMLTVTKPGFASARYVLINAMGQISESKTLNSHQTYINTGLMDICGGENL